MDLTPIYIFAAILQVVLFVGFITIQHPPVKSMLLLMMGGVLGVVLYVSTIPN